MANDLLNNEFGNIIIMCFYNQVDRSRISHEVRLLSI